MLCRGCFGKWLARPFWAAASGTFMPTPQSARVPHQSLHHGGQAPAGCAGPKLGGARVYLWQTTTPLPISPFIPGTARSPWACCMSRVNFLTWAPTKTCSDGPKRFRTRPAVRRGQRVNRVWGDEAKRLPERHSRQRPRWTLQSRRLKPLSGRLRVLVPGP